MIFQSETLKKKKLEEKANFFIKANLIKTKRAQINLENKSFLENNHVIFILLPNFISYIE